MEEKIHKCHDCGCKEGEMHKDGCDMEYCPFCGGQLLSCECPQKFGDKFGELLEIKGRIPFIMYPVRCIRCGVAWPEFFHVPDHEWYHYIQPGMRGTVICQSCYEFIKRVTDNASKPLGVN